MVQNILFDLDETLLDFKRSESRALSNMLRHIGVEPTERSYPDTAKSTNQDGSCLNRGCSQGSR